MHCKASKQRALCFYQHILEWVLYLPQLIRSDQHITTCSMACHCAVSCRTFHVLPPSSVVRSHHRACRSSRSVLLSEARSSPHPSAPFRPCLRPSERVAARSVPSKPPPGADRAGATLTGAVRTGLEPRVPVQSRKSVDLRKYASPSAADGHH